MQLLDILGLKLFQELHAAYRPILDEIMQLERDYPVVARNHVTLSEESRIMGNAQANLLFALQGTVAQENRRTRYQIREALVVLQHIPGMRSAVVALLLESFSATVYMVEHLFFLNRDIDRRLREEPRPADLHAFTVETAVYPMERVDEIVAHTYEIWKATYVLQNT